MSVKRKSQSKPPFAVKRSSIQGKGVFATRLIAEEECIVEYTGELIDEDEALSRYDDMEMKRHHTFLFAVNNKMSIDGASGGNDARFINHSCDPNCEARMDDGDRVFIYALVEIPEGTELTYDYSYVGVDAHDPEVRAMYACRCGSPKCRGSIGAPPKPRKKRVSSKKTAGAKKGAGRLKRAS